MANGPIFRAITTLIATTLVGTSCAPVAPYSAVGSPAAGGPYATGPQGYTAQAPISCPRSIPGVPAIIRNQISQQCRDAQRQQREAERQSRMPHVVSVSFSQPLTPARGLTSQLTGNTITFEAPVVQNGIVTRTEKAVIYLAADGKSYTASSSAVPWYIVDNSLCIGASQGQNCRGAFYDGSGRMVLVDQRQTVLAVTGVSQGDAYKVKAQYAQAKRNNDAVAGVLVALLLGAMASDGGGSGGNSYTDNYDLPRRQSGGSSSSGSGSYTAPIGGERGLYGSCHGVGC